MEYRTMEKLGVSPSLLGFGCMRFPVNPDGSICEAKAEEMLDTAIKAGVTYIDTAYPYHNGDSEPFVGKVLKKYDRKSFFLATKLPMWDVNSLEDAKRIFHEQLERLQTEYIDFYLLHCLDKEKWEKTLKLELIPYMEELQRQGKIRFFGFSFHDDFETFKTILTYRQWDFCQIQYNYIDTQISRPEIKAMSLQKSGDPHGDHGTCKRRPSGFLPEEVTAPFKDYNPEHAPLPGLCAG